MFDDWPALEHLVAYIPGVLIVGIAIGFRLGAKAARAEAARDKAARRR